MGVRNGIEQFLADVAPLFRTRRLTYVDVGAFRGEVLRKVIASGLQVDEAHLIDPNEESLQAARKIALECFKGRSLDFYPLALGASKGRVKIHPAKSMTKVVESVENTSTQHYDNDFEAECTTLDELSSRITDRRISLLKVDVEGYELAVLQGARELLKDQRVDVLYIEAGMNPSTTQQTYYRKIEDVLLSFGYRVFGVYEQVNEWRDDLPVLRRVNIAFVSERFALSNPYRLTRELHDIAGELETSRNELAATRQQLTEIETELRNVRASEHDLKESLSREATERAALEVELASYKEAVERQRRELGQAKQSFDIHEQALIESVRTIRQLYTDREHSARQAKQALSEVAHLRNSTSFRLGALLVQHARSPRRWLSAPIALWREFKTFRTRRKAFSTLPKAESVNTFAISASDPPIFINVDARPTIVTISDPDRSIDVACVTAFPERPSMAVTLGVSFFRDSEDAEESRGELGRHRDLMMRRFSLPPGVSVRIPLVRSRRLLVKLSLVEGRNCLIKLDVPSQSHNQEGRKKRPSSSRSIGPTDSSSSASSKASIESGLWPVLSASDLQKRLWAGFAEYALPALERLVSDQAASTNERVDAAWHLACWFFVEEQYDKALECVRVARTASGKERIRYALTEAMSLMRLGRYDEAEVLINQGVETADNNVDFLMLRSTLVRKKLLAAGASRSRAEEEQLAALNEVYRAANLAPLRKRKSDAPLDISNLTADARPKEVGLHHKISVIVPAYNAAQGIEWVLHSLLEQTWRNLEIIVVDDCSTDDTSRIVEGVANRDTRVRLIRHDRNRGAYAARNTGLKHSTGELITIHDSDDWSHPQRLELQTLALLADPTLIAVKSHWVRVHENLEIVGSWRPKDTLTDLNFSSLLFHRALIDLLGSWDNVRVSGDAEFYSRIKRVFGDHAVAKIPRRQMLALALSRTDSLTRARGAHHVRSLHYGIRCNYRHAYRYWHSKLTHESRDLPFDPNEAKRKFPLPPGNDPARQNALLKYDVVVVSDFAMRGGAFVSTLNYVVAASRAGKKVGVVHWRKYDLNPEASLQPRLYDACITLGFDILSPGDRVIADVVLIGYPAVLQWRVSPFPDIEARHVLVIVNQYASRLTNGQDQQYDPELAHSHLRELFGSDALWIPISNRVKRLLEEDQRYPDPYPCPWHPMIDIEHWCDSAIRWRGAERERPVVGRHGRDAYTKWPSNRTVLAQAYGVHQEWDVRILGGANHALAMLGSRPNNWTIIPFDGMPTKTFLESLDFYIHYPHENYIEEFGRSVMEAMAVGVPVILPPDFAETFGDAATYAHADQVAEVVDSLWSSRDAYLERAKAGRAFVHRNCDLHSFGERLAGALDYLGTLGRSSDVLITEVERHA